jgi:arabinofuranosyltransferase
MPMTVSRSTDQSAFPPLMVLLPPLFLSLVFLAAYWGHTLEDAMISFRYALRVAEHYPFGYWNRVGPAVEGYTSMLWVWILSFAGPNIDRIITLSKFCGTLSFLGIPTAFLFMGSRPVLLPAVDAPAFRRACAFAALATLVYVPLIWYAAVGMETTLFALLVTLVMLAPICVDDVATLTAFNILAVTTRPDGAVFVLLSALSYLLLDERHRRRRACILGLALSALTALFAWRISYFGYPMPNTYYAKAGGAGLTHIPAGLHYVGTWTLSHPWLLIPVLICLGIKFSGWREDLPRFLLALVGTLSIYAILIIKVGGDDYAAFPFWRHALQVTPLLFFLTFYSLELVKAPSWIRPAVLLSTFAWPLLGLVPNVQSANLRDQAIDGLHRHHLMANQPFNPFFIWLRSMTDDSTLISTSLAGELPLAVDAIHIDALGLNDEFIAHHGTFDPHGTIDSKSDMAYVMSKRPDIVEGYVSASSILRRHPFSELIKTRPKMVTEMLTNDEFRNNYVFVTNAPYEFFDRAIFMRADFYESSVRRGAMLEAVPVTQILDAYR